MEDGIVDSDEETDFSKMDMGNKKGPVGRYYCISPGILIKIFRFLRQM